MRVRRPRRWPERRSSSYLVDPGLLLDSGVPTGTVGTLHELVGRGQVLGFHVWPVPFHTLTFAHAQRDAAQQYDFSEISRDFEIRISRLAALHHLEPLHHVTRRAGDRLRHRLAGLVLITRNKRVLAFHANEEARA